MVIKWAYTGGCTLYLRANDRLVRMIIFNGQGYNVYDITGFRAELLVPLVKTLEDAIILAEESLG